MSEHDRRTADAQSSAAGILARLWWMLLGNAVLAFCIIFIFQHKGVFLHAADGVFWIGVASLVLVRYLDVRFLNGSTAVGEPASMRHWARYAVLLVIVCTVFWALAHGANYLFINKVAAG